MLPALRARFAPAGINALVVGSADAHQSEYVTDADMRRAFVSGFTGSAGTAVVSETEARLWTDGRYFLQATQQLSSDWELMRDREPDTPSVPDWLAAHLPAGSAVGVDARLLSAGDAEAWEKALGKKGVRLVATEGNLVDELWTEQPPFPSEPLLVHPEALAGKSAAAKRADLRAAMAGKAAAVVLTALDDIMWLFNVRGSDIPFNPVAHCFALVTPGDARLFVDASKVTPEVEAHLGAEVTLRPYEAVCDDLRELCAALDGDAADGKVWLDPRSCSWAVAQAVPEPMRLRKPTPVALAKAVKNEVELEGLRQAHLRDGAALTEFLCWLEAQVAAGAEGLDEVSVSDRLEQFRRAREGFVSLSFTTISSVGANGAIIHYHPLPGSCAALDRDSMYLCDSGAQYVDGTTDVTRTVHFGRPSQHERECFTRVLQGHIAFAAAKFPPGTPGSKLDTLARVPLWSAGLDFRHGTGHGVGAYLNVHEGPQGASMRARAGEEGLVAGMTMTDEPGYYEDGAFGVRIESVLVVREASTQHAFGGKSFLEFENITMAPIQTSLVVAGLLREDELRWLNAYNAEVREKLTPLLQSAPEALAWLEFNTQPL